MRSAAGPPASQEAGPSKRTIGAVMIDLPPRGFGGASGCAGCVHRHWPPCGRLRMASWPDILLAAMNRSRRDFITLAAAAAATATCTPCAGALTATALPGAEASLDHIARPRGLRFGSAMAYHQLSDSRYCSLMRAQCGVMVTENELKWQQVAPSAGTSTFEHGDALA